MFRHRLPYLLCFGLVLLAACMPTNQATPVLIAAYPPNNLPYATVPPRLLVSYEAYLELTVSDVAQAEAQAQQLAYDHGGYLASSQNWSEKDQRHATLVLAVPMAQFETLYAALKQQGQLGSENLTGNPVNTSTGANPWNTFGHITLTLHPTPPAFTLPTLPNIGWNPANTFGSAFKVFAAIFTFLLDILIWLLVVVGPFALIGWGIYVLARRLQKAK